MHLPQLPSERSRGWRMRPYSMDLRRRVLAAYRRREGSNPRLGRRVRDRAAHPRELASVGAHHGLGRAAGAPRRGTGTHDAAATGDAGERPGLRRLGDVAPAWASATGAGAPHAPVRAHRPQERHSCGALAARRSMVQLSFFFSGASRWDFASIRTSTDGPCRSATNRGFDSCSLGAVRFLEGLTCFVASNENHRTLERDDIVDACGPDRRPPGRPRSGCASRASGAVHPLRPPTNMCLHGRTTS